MDAELRELVRQRARGVCEYCRMPQRHDLLPFQIDHIIAEKHHGETVAENLALSCFNCNVHKGPNVAGLDPLTGQVTALFHPRRDPWNDHFRWDDDETLRGRTPAGRATVDVLNINLPARREHRRLLSHAGLLSH